MCNIRSQTQRPELIRKCDFEIWDELPKNHKYCIEALDISLRDLRNESLFGGKTILFSGDWRQISLIVKFGSPSDTVEAAVISSRLWKSVTRMRLTISQRDKRRRTLFSILSCYWRKPPPFCAVSRWRRCHPAFEQRQLV